MGDLLFGWDGVGHLLRADASTGKVSRIESWNRRFPNDQTTGDTLLFTSSPRREFAERCDAAFALPDGRLAFPFASARNNPRDYVQRYQQEDKVRLLLFDPVNDTWQEAEGPAEVDPIAIGARVLGVDKDLAYEWRGSRWQSIGPLPIAARELPFSDERETTEQKATLAGTQRYLYKETPLGLYRVAWSALATP